MNTWVFIFLAATSTSVSLSSSSIDYISTVLVASHVEDDASYYERLFSEEDTSKNSSESGQELFDDSAPAKVESLAVNISSDKPSKKKKPYVCKCGVEAISLVALDEHERKYHRVRNVISKRGLFMCTYPKCGKSYKKESALHIHVGAKHTIKSHSCTLCSARSVSLESLQKHIIKHRLFKTS